MAAWRKRLSSAVLAVLIGGVALFATGCFDIVSVEVPDGVEAGPTYTIKVTLKPQGDATDNRFTLAFRFPQQWEVQSVSYDGDQAGELHFSQPITDYFTGTWSGEPADAGHNGQKPGYQWWAGYSDPETLAVTDSVVVTIVLRPLDADGTYFFDFVAGATDAANPGDPASNGDGAVWEAGSAGDPPTGAVLDQSAALSAAVAPTVTGVVPESGAGNVSLATDLRVTFSEPMHAAKASDPLLVYVRKVGSPVAVPAPLPGTLFYNPGTLETRIELDAPLEYDTPYVIVVKAGVTDEAGNGLAADFQSFFWTAPVPPAPQVSGRQPEGVNVPLDSDILVSFDRAMDPATITAANLKLEVQAEDGLSWIPVPVSVSFEVTTDIATLTPASPLEPGATYRASLTTDIQSAAGMPLAAEVSWQFTTVGGSFFLDVPGTHPYFQAIQGMAEASIINGYDVAGGKEFRPDNDVWRWQFAKMICGALGLAVNESLVAPFPDLGPDSPANLEPHDYVAAATAEQIIRGYPDGTFRAYTPISRAQVVTMVVRALSNRYPGTLAAPPSGFTATWGSFHSEHGPNARIAEFNGLLQGLPLGSAANDPWQAMPRGEVAQVLWNMMELIMAEAAG